MIYIRTKDNQGKHDRCVLFHANDLIKAGWTVSIDLPSYAKPMSIGDYIPDIYAVSGNQEIVIEVETTDSVTSAHALAQKATFQSWERQSAGRQFSIRII